MPSLLGWGRLHDVDVRMQMYRLGGVATRAAIISLTSRHVLEQALRDGVIVRHGRGRYALPVVDEAVALAHAHSGVLSLLSAALYWGWSVKTVPDRPHITVPRKRRVSAARQLLANFHWMDLSDDDVADGRVTTMRKTIVDCMRCLPFDEALAVADSALRSGSFTQQDLFALAGSVRGPGRRACLRVAAAASGRAANPFESVLRAIAWDVPGLTPEPQVAIAALPVPITPDVVDRGLKLALEADSFAWHGERSHLKRDCRRYNVLVLLGWRVLRFTWEDVMLHPEYVRACLIAAVNAADGQAEVSWIY